MKTKIWYLCLLLSITPLLLLAQADGSTIITDTFLSPAPDSAFTSFQVQTRDNKIYLQWQVDKDSADYFTVERSVEGKVFETIGIMKAVENLFKYEFADEVPSRGQAYYRVRFTGKNGTELYSQPVTVLVPGATFFRFYPNPADRLLILRADGPVDVQVVDGFGKQRITKTLSGGPQVIDVSFLEKGVYILRITDKVSGRQQYDKFLKN